MKEAASQSVNQLAQLHELGTLHPYRQIDFKDRAWRYLVAGSGTRTLLLLPGAFVGAVMWFHLITIYL